MPAIGIGGIFFRSRDPHARAEWYRRHLGINAGAEGEDAVWEQTAGVMVFAPFSEVSDHFDRDQPFMINFRVTGLAQIVAGLLEAGVEVEQQPGSDSDVGSFVRLRDPEGLPLELWELPA